MSTNADTSESRAGDRGTAANKNVEFDVAIVGAGLAGLQCARLLGRAGLRVLLVDRKMSLAKTIHTTGIFVRKTLEDFQFPEGSLGPVVRQVKLYSPARKVLTLESDRDEFRVGRMGLLYEQWLVDCRRVGVTWWGNTRFVGALPEGAGSRIALLKGNEATGSVRECEVTARFLIGADGTDSRVAMALKLDRNREWIVGAEEVLEGVPLGDGKPCFHCFLDSKLSPGYLAWVAHDGEEVHLGVGGYASQFKPLEALQEFRTSVSELFDLSAAEVVQRRGGKIPVGGVLKRIVCDRGLLVGDAAGAVSPLTAGGLDPCLRLSDLAARVAIAYVESGNPEVLAAYSGEQFRAKFRSRLWMRKGLAAMRSQLVLEAACGVLRLPVAKSLARHVFFSRGSFPDVEGDRVASPELS